MVQLRQVLGLLGLLAGILAIASDSGLLIWVAIVLLGGSLALRAVAAVQRRRRGTEP